jgi:NitT/TauT family transport system ATP-binding protein
VQATGSRAALLEARDVSLVYKTRRGTTTALQDMSCTLHQGEFLSILGPSGCGKSSFLRLAAGLLDPSSGAISLSGSPVTAPRRDVGVVFQQATLLPWQTALQNVMLPIDTLRLDQQAGKTRALQLLKLVGLKASDSLYPGEMSGGMQQRVGIARGLVHNPSLLLMDEPFAALDAMTREHMMVELQSIWASQGCSVIFITHSIPEAVFLSDRIVVMSARPGRVVREIEVDLPRPRSLQTMRDPRFAELTHELRELFNELLSFE